MRGKIKKWLGIDKLEHKVDELNNEKLVILKTIGEVRNNINLLKNELNELRLCKDNIDDVCNRIVEIENKLNELESFHNSLNVISANDNKNNIEDTILNIISNGKDVCISDLLTYTNLTTRELYNILSKLESLGKIKRKRKGKKVIVEGI
ncbi:hypothetical protein [Methanothermococcus okinawensis]|uniref:Uncharacterized protein n=1 Tax=Methanothermococcus okinawensis (strain DSM 14208 / JCM 11175 / IH1) TaxID=647113 RepID=F8AP25_METOI|nr:hypothetical protein [Methanothermococcus okinawensis]AEH07593.1 hypothetical protein Metok_1631 [Methanothermococcus okinawensis IH1]